MKTIIKITVCAPILAACVLIPRVSAQQSSLGDAVLAEAITAVMKQNRIPGVCVGIMRGKDLIYREAFGFRNLAKREPMTCETLFQVGSVTKTFTATLMGILMEAELLTLDDPIELFLPDDLELGERMSGLTLRQLATHSAGLPRDPANRRDLPDSPGVMLPYSIAELYEGLMATELKHEPGSRWHYSNLGYGLLGHILELASGQEYEDLLREKILEPLGMKNTGIHPNASQDSHLATHYWPEDAELVGRERWHFGDVVGFAGIFSNLDDMAAYLGAQYLGPQSGLPIREATLRTLHGSVVSVDERVGRKMSPGWFIDSFPGIDKLIGHGGEVDGHSCCVAFLPEQKAGVIVFANLGDRSAEEVITVLLQQAMPMLLQR